MTQLKLAILALLAMTGVAQAASVCLSQSAEVRSVAITASSTARLVVGSPGARIHVCAITFTAATGTAATYTFNEGTGTTCGTGTVADSGAFIGGAPIVSGAPGDLFTTAVLDDLCITLGGTGGSAQGVLSYVQQ